MLLSKTQAQISPLCRVHQGRQRFLILPGEADHCPFVNHIGSLSSLNSRGQIAGQNQSLNILRGDLPLVFHQLIQVFRPSPLPQFLTHPRLIIRRRIAVFDIYLLFRRQGGEIETADLLLI